MSASSSRITIAPVDGSRPLSDRLIDRLLGWWDLGTRRIRRWLRTAGAAIGTRLHPFLARPPIARTIAILSVGGTTVRRWLAKAFAHDSPLAAPQPHTGGAGPDTTASPDAPVAPRPTVAPRSATGEIRTPLRSPTGEIRTPTRAGTGELRTPTRAGTGEIRPRTASSITRPEVTPTSTPTRTTTLTTALRCWSCLQRTRVRAPRRGGCFLCSACNTTMLVVDPIVGVTCDVAQAEGKGINLNRQADETDPALGPDGTTRRR